MKKLIYAIIFAVSLMSCSDDTVMKPALSLFSDKPEILDETAVFRMAVINMPDGEERHFPVTFGGTAEFGIDYEVSGDEFIFGVAEPVDSIVVKTLKFGTGRTVSMNVTLPEGMESGRFLSAEFTLHEKPALITFNQDRKILADSAMVSFSLKDKEGKDKVLGIDAEVSVSVDREKSTAVEGEDFVFADSSHFNIIAGKSSGELKIKKLKDITDEGRDKIVFRISHDPKFAEGTVRELEMDLMDAQWGSLKGKWKIDTLVTDTTYMKNFWGDKCTGYDLFPKFQSADAVSFDLNTASFTPSFSSDFKLYFTGLSKFTPGPKMSLDLGDGKSADLQTFILDNTNRNFVKEPASEDKESIVGARIIEGLEENPDTLDFYVIDYVSKSFMPELEAQGKYAPEKPVAASPGLYINITFVK